MFKLNFYKLFGLIYKYLQILINFSRDVTVPRPPQGEYYFLLEAKKDFGELLVTAIMDTPPDARAAFTIRRMGHFARRK